MHPFPVCTEVAYSVISQPANISCSTRFVPTKLLSSAVANNNLRLPFGRKDRRRTCRNSIVGQPTANSIWTARVVKPRWLSIRTKYHDIFLTSGCTHCWQWKVEGTRMLCDETKVYMVEDESLKVPLLVKTLLRAARIIFLDNTHRYLTDVVMSLGGVVRLSLCFINPRQFGLFYPCCKSEWHISNRSASLLDFRCARTFRSNLLIGSVALASFSDSKTSKQYIASFLLSITQNYGLESVSSWQGGMPIHAGIFLEASKSKRARRIDQIANSTRYNAVSWPSDFCKIFQQSPGNGISVALNLKNCRGSMSPYPWPRTTSAVVHQSLCYRGA